MRQRSFKRVAVFGTVAALGLGGCGGQAATSATSSGSSNQPAAQQGQPPDFSALAKKLGVSESKLQKAMQANRPQPGAQPSGMAASLAKALGISEAKVSAALKDFMPQGGPPSGGQAPPSSTAGAQSS
jgi:biotin operon repressor